MSGIEEASDEALVARIKAGDDASLRVLTERYTAKLRARVESRLRGGMRRKVAASDILQEANVVAFAGQADFEDRGPGSFERWFGRIVELKIREAVNRHVGTAKRGIGHERSQVGSRVARDIANAPSPSQVFAGEELKDAARQALEALPESHREVLCLLQDKGMSLEDAATSMGRSKEATKKLYGRALARLEEFMGLRARRDGGRRRPTR